MWSSRRSRLRFDTSIGVLFAGTFALGVLLFSTIDGYTGDLLGYLLGNILGIGAGDLIQVAILGAVVLAIVRRDPQGAALRDVRSAGARPRRGCRSRGLEYLLLGLLGVTIIVSIQAVGIILVVAMLVTPAATAQLLVVRFDRLMALAVGDRGRLRRRRAVRELLRQRRVGRGDRAGRDASSSPPRCSSDPGRGFWRAESGPSLRR